MLTTTPRPSPPPPPAGPKLAAPLAMVPSEDNQLVPKEVSAPSAHASSERAQAPAGGQGGEAKRRLCPVPEKPAGGQRGGRRRPPWRGVLGQRERQAEENPSPQGSWPWLRLPRCGKPGRSGGERRGSFQRSGVLRKRPSGRLEGPATEALGKGDLTRSRQEAAAGRRV